MTKEEAPEIHTLVCKKCGEDVSGSDLDDVKAAMARHHQKTGHKGQEEEEPDAGA